MIKAVVFDMDGVLIDSEIVYLDCLCEKLRMTYPELVREDFFPIVGASSARTKEIIAKLIGADAGSAEFGREYEHIWDGCRADYPAILRKEVPGLLRELKSLGYLAALASSTSRRGIDEVLTACCLTPYFDYVVSGEMFKESKPNPEIYLHTAGFLDCDPSECMAVEDSTYGIMAGHGAGMTVAALIDERFGFDRSQADFSIYSLSEIPGILEEMARLASATQLWRK